MKELLEQGVGVVVIGIMTGIGIVTRMVLFGYYGRLCRACKRMEKTNNKTIVYIKNDLKERVERKQQIKSALIYTECRLTERKVCGIQIGIWESILQQSIWLVLLSGILSAFACVLSGCEREMAISLLFISGGAVFVLLLQDLFGGLREKNKRIRLEIQDYIENCWGIQTEQNVDIAELGRPKKREIRKEKKSERLAEKQCLRQGKPKKKHMKKHGKAQEEKRRLTEELLRERRQLEARSFAEQRRKEREEENVVQQAQAETAVTECGKVMGQDISEATVQAVSLEATEDVSYEILLREVLAEYLR